MADSLFDIVFRGDIIMGHSLQDVKARLAQLFKVDAAKVEVLFSGGVVILKRNVDAATAEKYKAVLTKAGAQVQIRPAGTAAKTGPAAAAKTKPAPKVPLKAPPKARRESVDQTPNSDPGVSSRAQGQASVADSGFSLAPTGSDLLKPSELKQRPALDLDVSAITLKPMEGDLLENSEKRGYFVADYELDQIELAEPGADLLEGFEREEVLPPVVDPDFEVAEAGADLLEAADRPRETAVKVSTDHLDILPLK